MTLRIVGFSCAAMVVLLLVLSIWFSGGGQSEAGLISLGLAMALLLVAAATLRSGRNRV